MKVSKHPGSRLSLSLAAVLVCSVGVAAQDSQERPTLNKDKQQQQSQQPAANTLSLETPSAPPASSEEDTALKTITAMPEGNATNLQTKIDAMEGFLQKYPQTRFRSLAYTFLTMGYVQMGKADKGIEYGDRELELNPNDVATMAIVSQTIPRVFNPSSPDAAKKLEKAETLGKRAVEIIPTLPKPDGMPDEVFISTKNQTLAMAHGGLGLVDWRRGKYEDAIPELEQSVKLDTVADPVNWLILGVVNQNAAHFDAASAAFTHCASINGSLQNTCKTKAEEAKKLAATKLSAPK